MKRPHEYTVAEAAQMAMDAALAPIVRHEGAFFEFYDDGEMVYDVSPKSPSEALRWIEHLSGKSWITKEHLGLFALLSAEAFGVGRT